MTLTNRTKYWTELLPNLRTRGVDEAMGSVFFRNEPLNRWLRETLSAEGPDAEFPLLGEPLFEAVFPWKSAGKSLDALMKSGLLHSETIKAGELFAPYTHQYEAYRLLLNDPHASVVISSGTGSGKTECFMAPIIESIVREIEAGRNRPGIRALFLYPLNALIANQKKRFSKFTAPFDGDIRYALYTGELEEDAKSRRLGASPAELNSRRVMREKIPHLLVTNPTMLEYMLLRKKDEGMIAATKRNKTFKWIVLDEAHTYIGSSAAEMALLLRRVLNAFEVDPNDVHFIATSATIDASDREKLRRFLVDLSGADEKNVHIILGERDFPPRIAAEGLSDGESLDALQAFAETANDEALQKRLKASRRAMTLRNAFIEKGFLKLGEIERILETDRAGALGWLDLLTKPSGRHALLPLRLQQMMNTTDLFNVCPDPECPAKTGALQDPAWRFGAVWLDGRQTCSCGAPLFPLAACSKCSTVSLSADLVIDPETLEQRLVRPRSEKANAEAWRNFELLGTADLLEQSAAADEEAAEALEADKAELKREAEAERQRAAKREAEDVPEDFDRSASAAQGGALAEDAASAPGVEEEAEPSFFCESEPVLITNAPEETQSFELRWQRGGEWVARSIRYRTSDENGFVCPGCRERLPRTGFYLRRISPRYSQPLMPLVLDYGGTPQADRLGMRPMDGRKILSFTDSRQGTAKAAALMEQLGEKSLLASMLYKSVDAAPLTDEAANYRAAAETCDNPALKAFFEKKYQDALVISGADKSVIRWSEFSKKLALEIDDSRKTYSHLFESFSISDKRLDAQEIAEILLLREFGARPINGATLETCGLIKVDYWQLNNALMPPAGWPHGEAGWRSYLKILLDFFVRYHRCIRMPGSWRQFGGNSRIFERRITPLESREKTRQNVDWPAITSLREHRSRIIRYTAAIIGADAGKSGSRSDAERINDVLRAAYKDLKRIHILEEDDSPTSRGLCIDLAKNVEFSINGFAWRFEGINKLFDTIVGAPETAVCPTHVNIAGAKRTEIPRPPKAEDAPDSVARRNTFRRFMAESAEFRALVDTGCWNTSGTFAYEQANYFAAAEHTAQLDKTDRRSHEASFEDGRINILASSTTMEMGIDLGDIGAVVLNGVPPHPANYLQRIGRAGRRNETRINALTFCRTGARDRDVFRNPDWALKEKQPELSVSLSSRLIAERHVTAEILGLYLHGRALNGEKLTMGDWIANLHADFGEWIRKEEASPDPELCRRLSKVVRYSALEGRTVAAHCRAAYEAIDRVVRQDRLEIERYDRRIAAEANDTVKRSLTRRRNFMASVDALKRLTECLALPSSIRVVNTVQLERPFEKESKREKDGALDRSAGVTTREGRYGIFEYAPGASTIIDGTNYTTTGIRVTWTGAEKNASLTQAVPTKKVKRCPACGERFLAESADNQPVCPTCGSANVHDDGEALLPEGFVVAEADGATKDSQTTTYIKEPPMVLLDAPWMPADLDARVLTRAACCARILSINDGARPRMAGRTKDMRFAVCLACGFSKLVPENPEEDENWRRHYPASFASPQCVSDLGLCMGADKGYLFRDSVSLASEWQTDCLQVSLEIPPGLFVRPDDADRKEAARRRRESAGIGIGVALRRAVAEYYGISEDELLFTHAVRTIGGRSRLVISVYDGAMAGYSSGAAKAVDALLGRALQILRCPANRCSTACAACVLRFDSQKAESTLDRHDGLALLESCGIERIAAGIDLGVAREKGRLITAPLPEYLEAAFEARDASSVCFFVRERPDEFLRLAATDVFQLARRLSERRAAAAGKPVVTLAAVGFDWASLPSAQRTSLAFLGEYGVAFARVDLRSKADEAVFERLFAVTVSSHGKAEPPCGFFYAGAPETTEEARREWTLESEALRIAVSPIESALPEPAPQPVPAAEPERAPLTSGVAREVSFQGCTVAEFGDAFILKSIQAIAPEAERIDDVFNAPVESVVYTDNYLERAGEPALLLSIFRAVAESADAADASFVVRTGVPKNRNAGSGFQLPNQLYRPWPDEEVRRTVFSALEKRAAAGSPSDGIPAMRLTFDVAEGQLPVHHRQLLIRFANGEALEILPDQGVGCVEFDRFRLQLPYAKDWAIWLYRACSPKNAGSLRLSDSRKHPTHLSVSKLEAPEDARH